MTCLGQVPVWPRRQRGKQRVNWCQALERARRCHRDLPAWEGQGCGSRWHFPFPGGKQLVDGSEPGLGWRWVGGRTAGLRLAGSCWARHGAACSSRGRAAVCRAGAGGTATGMGHGRRDELPRPERIPGSGSEARGVPGAQQREA